MENRPATRNEIIEHFKHHRPQFETYCREVADSRTESGVRHIRKATAKVRNVNGVPTVKRLGEDFELFATFYTLESGRTFVASPTIIRKQP